MSKPFRVLCLDGGGVLGYYTASVLENLSELFNVTTKEHSPDVGKSFDLICGTSTGAILACGLANGTSVDGLRKIYKKNLKDIFPIPLPRSKIKLFFWALFNTLSPTASKKALDYALKEMFKEKTLGELYSERKIGLCIPSVHAQTYHANIFRTPHLADQIRDSSVTLRDACIASAAAPIYFPVASIANGSDSNVFHVDGGLWANNPVIIGLIEAIKMAEKDQVIEIYSLGNIAFNDASITTLKNRHRGLLGWIIKADFFKMFLTVQSHGQTKMASELAKVMRILGKDVNVYRFPQGKLTDKELSHLGLDSATDKAFEIMENVAYADALNIMNLAKDGDATCHAIKTLYQEMQSL